MPAAYGSKKDSNSTCPRSIVPAWCSIFGREKATKIVMFPCPHPPSRCFACIGEPIGIDLAVFCTLAPPSRSLADGGSPHEPRWSQPRLWACGCHLWNSATRHCPYLTPFVGYPPPRSGCQSAYYSALVGPSFTCDHRLVHARQPARGSDSAPASACLRSSYDHAQCHCPACSTPRPISILMDFASRLRPHGIGNYQPIAIDHQTRRFQSFAICCRSCRTIAGSANESSAPRDRGLTRLLHWKKWTQ